MKRQLPNAAPLRRLRRLLAALPSGTPTSSAYLVAGVAVAIPLLTAGAVLPSIGHGALEQDPGGPQSPAAPTVAAELNDAPTSTPAPDPSSAPISVSSVDPGSGSAHGAMAASERTGDDHATGTTIPGARQDDDGDVGAHETPDDDRGAEADPQGTGQPTTEPTETELASDGDDDPGDREEASPTPTPTPTPTHGIG